MVVMRTVAVTMSLAWLSPAAVMAHDGTHAASDSAGSAWDLAILLFLVTAGVLYAIGSRRLARRGAHRRRAESVAFWSGLVALVAAVAPPLDAAAARAFSSHMIQHELLMRVGAPLVIAGRPIVPWLWALPDGGRQMAASWLRAAPAAGLWNWLTAPLTAWALHGAAVWIWHTPALYEAAVASEGVHALQHATFVGTAVFFWWGLVYGRYGRAAYGASVLYVFTTMMHTGALGAMFALSRSPFYGIYAERAAAAGIDPVADQQLAGIYMWIPSGLVLTLMGLALLVAWLAESDRRARWRAVIVLLPLVAAASGACRQVPYAEEARMLTGGDPYLGRDHLTAYGCATCHTIPGVPGASAHVGPPLTAIARRTYLAGRLENTPGNMMRWIREPHAVDEMTAMPDTGVTEQDSRDITAYLYTLR